MDKHFVFANIFVLCGFQDGEKKGVSPEEVYTSIKAAGENSIPPYKWLKTELPPLLDQIRMAVATSTIHIVCDGNTTEQTVSALLSSCLILTVFCSEFLVGDKLPFNPGQVV